MKTRRRLVALVLAATSAAPTLTLWAQPKQQAAAAARNAAGAAQQAKPPLESLDDNKLMAELAGRGMTGLLDYYFQKNNVPDERRKETLVIIALKNLDSDAFAKKPPAEQKKAIQDIVDGINQILPTINDPQRLMRYAAELVINGTQRVVDLLELWGDSPKVQATLNPIAETVDKIYAQAITESDNRANALLAQIKADNDPRIKQWEEFHNLSLMAEFNRACAAYGLAISYDKAAVEQRKKVCTDAIESLKQFDTDDRPMPIQLTAKLTIAKLSMTLGGDAGYKQAKEYFQKVIDAKSDDEKDPNKYVVKQYQARFFTLVADLLAKHPDLAAKGIPELKDWQQKNLPQDKATQDTLATAMSMLEYRVDAALSATASDPAQREKLEGEAMEVLSDLVSRRPQYQGIVFEQLMANLPDKPDYRKLHPLMLEAAVTRGIDARNHKAPEKDDSKQIQQAADAAREIVRRKVEDKGTAITDALADKSAFFIGVFEEFIGKAPDLKPEERDVNKQDAVEAYVNYVERFHGKQNWSDIAMDQSIALILELRKSNPNDDRTNTLYDRVLDIGFNKQHRKELAYAYATRRRELSDFAAAAKAYAMVPTDDPQRAARATYYLMECQRQLLVKSNSPVEKQQLSGDIQKEADQLDPLLSAAAGKASDATGKMAYETFRVRARLLAADVARANKNPARVIELLNGFEGQLANLKMPQAEANGILGSALFLRVNALIALGRNDDAIKAVQDLIQHQKPDQALATIGSLVQQIDENFKQERGKETPDEQTLVQLASQRAQLAALLVQQVQKDAALPDNVKRQYLQFNATSQLQAAQLEKDPAKRGKYLDEARRTFDTLLQGLDPNSSEAAILQYRVATVQFELGDPDNVQKAHDTLQGLFAGKKFGGPMVRIEANQEAKINDMYWDALDKLLQAKVKLAAAHNDSALREEAARIMKQQVVIPFGDTAGGDAYGKDFRQLRKELLGDWKPPTDATATSQPATAPAAAAAR